MSRLGHLRPTTQISVFDDDYFDRLAPAQPEVGSSPTKLERSPSYLQRAESLSRLQGVEGIQRGHVLKVSKGTLLFYSEPVEETPYRPTGGEGAWLLQEAQAKLKALNRTLSNPDTSTRLGRVVDRCKSNCSMHRFASAIDRGTTRLELLHPSTLEPSFIRQSLLQMVAGSKSRSSKWLYLSLGMLPLSGALALIPLADPFTDIPLVANLAFVADTTRAQRGTEALARLLASGDNGSSGDDIGNGDDALAFTVDPALDELYGRGDVIWDSPDCGGFLTDGAIRELGGLLGSSAVTERLLAVKKATKEVAMKKTAKETAGKESKETP